MMRWFLCCGLCLAAGCTGSAGNCLPQRQQASAQSKGQFPAGVVVAKNGQERVKATVGQAVQFRFGYTVVPDMMISRLDVMVNGDPVVDPEVFEPETNPGYGELTYVFRPKKPGEYKVEVAPISSGGGGAASWWVVEVSD
jgi:hypothetical protein